MRQILAFALALTAISGSAEADTYQFRQSAKGVLAAALPPPVVVEPTHVYATWNPEDKEATIVLSNGNLTSNVTSWHSAARATMGKSTGKWYWEMTIDAGTNAPSLGIMGPTANVNNYAGSDSLGWGFCGLPNGSAQSYTVHSGANTAYGAAGSFDIGKTISVALDMTEGTVTFYSNGVSQGVAVSGLSGVIYPVTSGCNYNDVTITANFGQRPFRYPVPAGFNAGVYE